MSLAALQDEPDPLRGVSFDVGRGDPLWGAVNHHVRAGQQIGEVTGRPDAGTRHRRGGCCFRGVNDKTFLFRHPEAPVCRDVRDTRHNHIRLPGHGVGDALADHPVAIDRHPDL